MILRALAAAALFASAPAAAQMTRESDEFAYQVGGGQYLLGWKLETSMFADAEVLAQFQRIGADSACAIYNAHFRPIVARHEPEFRPVLIAAVRHQVPSEILFGSRLLAFEAAPMQARKGRIIAELETAGADLFADAQSELRSAFLAEAELAPTGAPDSFADWDMEKTLARPTACRLLRSGPPETLIDRKRPLDPMYRRGGAR